MHSKEHLQVPSNGWFAKYLQGSATSAYTGQQIPFKISNWNQHLSFFITKRKSHDVAFKQQCMMCQSLVSLFDIVMYYILYSCLFKGMGYEQTIKIVAF